MSNANYLQNLKSALRQHSSALFEAYLIYKEQKSDKTIEIDIIPQAQVDYLNLLNTLRTELELTMSQYEFQDEYIAYVALYGDTDWYSPKTVRILWKMYTALTEK